MHVVEVSDVIRFFFFKLFYFICMGALPACRPVHHLCVMEAGREN